MPKLTALSLLCLISSLFCKIYSQGIPDSISKEYLSKTVHYLASDKLKGRANYSAEQLEAGAFLNNEFANFGLQPLEGSKDFYWSFSIENTPKREASLLWNDVLLPESNYYFFSHGINEIIHSGFTDISE